MSKGRQLFLRLFVLSFAVSVSITVIPCSIINIHGLFGEVKASTVVKDSESFEILEEQVYREYYKYKGMNSINVWYELWISIACMIFILYMSRLPRVNTIVTLKVRMDD